MIPPAGIPFDAPDEAPEDDVGSPVPEVDVIRDVEEGTDVVPGVELGVGTAVVCWVGSVGVTIDVTIVVDVGIVVGAVMTLVVSGGGVVGVVAGVVGIVTGGVEVGVVTGGVVGVVTGGLVAAVDMATAMWDVPDYNVDWRCRRDK
jgi:hypothetical protein